MDLDRVYYDIDGNKCNILQLVKSQPEWAANVIQQQDTIRTCQWKHDDIDDFWETECGDDFIFTNGSPKENNAEYCSYCGGRILVDD